MWRHNALRLALLMMLSSLAVAGGYPGEVHIGEVLRDATMQGLNGAPRKLSDFRGKPLIVNLWASWCGPCKSEMASLERLAWLDPAGRFTVIGISTDDYPDKAMLLLRQSNATISQFIDSRQQLENLFGASRLPLTVLVGADGRVLDKIYGAREWDQPDALQFIYKTFRIRLDAAPASAARAGQD